MLVYSLLSCLSDLGIRGAHTQNNEAITIFGFIAFLALGILSVQRPDFAYSMTDRPEGNPSVVRFQTVTHNNIIH